MARKLIVSAEAREDIRSAAKWYRAQRPELAWEFRAAVKREIAAIRRNPMQFQAVLGEVRRAVLDRFPYILLYTFDDQQITVIGCIHGHRDPRAHISRQERVE